MCQQAMCKLVAYIVRRYSSCRQTSQEILELVNACNAQRDNVKRRVTDIRLVRSSAQGSTAPGCHQLRRR